MKAIRLLAGLLAALVAVSGVNIATTAGMLLSLPGQNAARPARVALAVLADPDCPSCFDAAALVPAFAEQSRAEVTETRVDANSAQGKDLIQQLGIRRIPALILSGETNRLSGLEGQGWTQAGGRYYFDAAPPPYRDLGTGEIVGLVSLTELADPSCADCFSFGPVISFLQEAGVGFSAQKQVASDSPEGADIAGRFSVARLPALIFSPDIRQYPQLAGLLGAAAERAGAVVLESLRPPYRDTATGEIRGLVRVTYLDDPSCADCYDVAANRQILAGLGVFVAEEQTVDVGSPGGKALLAAYGVTKVPAILLSPDAAEYASLAAAWPQVGSVAEDGWFVMTDPAPLGTIRDLAAA